MTQHTTKDGVTILVDLPDKKEVRYNHPSLVKACRNNERIAAVLDYFIYAASREVKERKPESCNVVKVTRSHAHILQCLTLRSSRKSLIRYLDLLTEWKLVTSERYGRNFDVHLTTIQEAINNPPAPPVRKPRKKKSCNVNNDDNTSTFGDNPSTFCEKCCNLNEKVEELQLKSGQVTTLSGQVTTLSGQVTTLQQTVNALVSFIQEHFSDAPYILPILPLDITNNVCSDPEECLPGEHCADDASASHAPAHTHENENCSHQEGHDDATLHHSSNSRTVPGSDANHSGIPALLASETPATGPTAETELQNTAITAVVTQAIATAEQPATNAGRRGKKSAQPPQGQKPKAPFMPPPDEMPWGTTKCLQRFRAWRGSDLIGKYNLSQASTCAKGLAENYSEEQVFAVHEAMNNDPYWISRGGADICDVANNIHKEIKKTKRTTPAKQPDPVPAAPAAEPTAEEQEEQARLTKLAEEAFANLKSRQKNLLSGTVLLPTTTKKEIYNHAR